MIPRTIKQLTDYSSPDWKKSLRDAITSPEELLQATNLPCSRWLSGAIYAARLFPLKVPREYVARIEPGNSHDPLLRQVLPLEKEARQHAEYSTDPVGDHDAIRQPGLLQKYQKRSLLVTTGACAIHCRYCFRRHFPYNDSHAGGQRLERILETLANDKHQEEIILSGGDPLMMDDEALDRLFNKLSAIRHIRRIRLHTRLPVVLPQRITLRLREIFNSIHPSIVLVIHCNHPREVDQNVAHALNLLTDTPCRLFNQSVLLRGVNDSVDTLCELSETLFAHRVQPYYLHQLDKVSGAHHFDLDSKVIQKLYHGLCSNLPGYLVPKLVKEVAGEPYKQLINHHQ